MPSPGSRRPLASRAWATTRRPGTAWDRGVRRHRRGVDQGRHAGRGGRLEDADAAQDVGAPRDPRIVGGLQQPGQVHDGVRAAQVLHQARAVVADVGVHPCGAGGAPVLGDPAGDADDVGHRRVLDEGPHQARPDVSGRPYDDDAQGAAAGREVVRHDPRLPRPPGAPGHRRCRAGRPAPWRPRPMSVPVSGAATRRGTFQTSPQGVGRPPQPTAFAIRRTASVSTSGVVARFSRAWPSPPVPKSDPGLRATLPRARKAAAGSSPRPSSRQSSQAR